MEAETETEPLEVHLLKQEVCEFVEPESEPPIRDNKDIQFECQVKNEPLEEYEYEEEEECNTLDYDVDHSDFKIAMPKIVVRECETIKNKISVRQQGKTSTERSREFRERKKALKNAASQGSIITKTKPKTAAERSRDYRARKRQKYEKTQESNYQQ
ncbi:uncharacterized protein LOC108096562 isoform X3 [Drosophila ficusphila]|uniref:uncharacterized protein LOC108096562 isoform X3 n=1 Tax=Drosophila ficusphila TaxID=30025 RepID=UPI0007E62825|nr:uncharacterized protein LOC108096562 isoform X3 [Drosophila ficusphila]